MNQKEIINIFPEISILKIYFIQNCNLDLIDLIRNLIKTRKFRNLLKM